jgi:hypothetical protein
LIDLEGQKEGGWSGFDMTNNNFGRKRKERENSEEF